MRASAFISASAGILLVLLLLSSGCGQRPASGSNTSFQPFWTTTAAPAGGTPVPTTPDVGVVVEITEIPVKPTTPVPPPTEEVTYVEIYNKELLFRYNTTALEYDLKYPPLIIDFTLKPEIVNRVTVTRDPTCTPTDTNLCLKTVTVTYPDPSAWFTITVKYLGSDQIVAQSGYNKEYDVSEEKRLTIRQPGYYHIEMTGSRLSAVVRMRVTTVTT